MPARKARGHLGILAVKVQGWWFPHQGQDELSLKPVRSEGGGTSAIRGSLLTNPWASNSALSQGGDKKGAGKGKNRPS